MRSWSKRTVGLSAACAIAALTALQPAAAVAKRHHGQAKRMHVKLGMYDCLSQNGATASEPWGAQYWYSYQFKKGHVYGIGNRIGRRLHSMGKDIQMWGRYTLHGRMIRARSGDLKKEGFFLIINAHSHRDPSLGLYWDSGKYAGITCWWIKPSRKHA